MQRVVRRLYEVDYKMFARPLVEEQREKEDKIIEDHSKIDFFDLHQELFLPSTITDEFHEYANVTRLKTMPNNLYRWWNDQNHLLSM